MHILLRQMEPISITDQKPLKNVKLPKFKNLQKGIAEEFEKGNYYHFAFTTEEETKDNLSETLNNINLHRSARICC